ncbi:hypothetical protein [Nostoc sp.]|uniref:hypothetical protein n=1 Tax=Nostoc sp. TaxID=1180 RepID=UPI002FF94EA6
MMQSAALFSYKVMMPAAGCANGVSFICDFSSNEQLRAWDTNYELLIMNYIVRSPKLLLCQSSDI